MQSKFFKKTLALVVVLAMAFTMINVGALTNAWAANGKSGSKAASFTKVANRGNGLFFATKEAAEAFEKEYVSENGTVRVSIVLDGKSAIAQGFSTKNLADAKAVSYRNSLRAEQDKVAARISANVLGGEKLDVVWNLTIAANIISANVPLDKIDAISNVFGVKKVVVETKYDVPVTETAEEPEIAVSAPMVGSEYAWAEGYTGLGSKVAIIDTGVDVDHELFDAEAFEYALSLTDKEYDLLTLEDVAAVFDQLHIKEKIPNASAESFYYTSKLPFGANYVDNNTNIDHRRDGQGAHGSHVAGIATGNRFVKRDGEFVSAVEAVKTQGEAPDAQLIVMKVFGANGGAYDSDYMVAIEDAFVLGCDSVNLSLGSAAAGFPTSDEYQNIVASFADTDTVVAISMGNNSAWADHAGGNLYDDDVNFNTGGSPGSFANAFTVASVDNGNYKFIDFGDGFKEIYNETSYNNEPFDTLAGEELEFVYLDKAGEKAQWEAIGGERVLEGKVAIVNRGDISFYVKIDVAAELGAIACIVVNNTTGAINMDLSQGSSTIPAVSISQQAGQIIKYYFATPVTVDNEVAYYTGTLSAGVSGKGEYKMSDFSSMGVPGDLSLKPEITAPGGNILSVDGDPSTQNANGMYVSMSGTSMASPQIAGLSAVMAQFVRENGLAEKTGLTPRQLITSLLMSTAVPLYDPLDPGYYYSVMKQGAGVVNLENALNAKSYITVDSVLDTAPKSAAASIADGKVKVELGNIKQDEFTVTFTVHNMSDEAVEYYFNTDFFTQYDTEGSRLNETNTLYLGVEWEINGEPYEPIPAAYYDFNGDGVVNIKDAQWLLRYIVDPEVEFTNYYDEQYADLDYDGDVDSADAKIAFELFGNSAYVAEPGEDVEVTLTVSGLEYMFESYYETDNYVEGYIFVTEGSSEDGELGTAHSIPVLGFYGDWAAHDMFDKGTPVEFEYETEERIPYMVYAVYELTGDLDTAFEMMANQSYKVFISSNEYYTLGGNPLFTDEEYMPDRNAISSSANIKSVDYTLIRNAGATRFLLADKYGRPVIDEELGAAYAAYYNPNDQNWYNYGVRQNLGIKLDGFKEGSEYTLLYQAAPEYYVDEDGSVDWDALPLDTTAITSSFVVDSQVPFIVGAETFEDDNGLNLVVSAHDNQYIAAVALFTEDGDYIGALGSFTGVRKGEQCDYEFNLSELFDGEEINPHILVEVYDYALNLSTYKLNLNPEELEDPEIGVEIVCDYPVIVNRGTLQLGYNFAPWGFEDETILWSSSDETIAVVDDDGLVTSVYEGEEDTEVEITATSAYDMTATDTITVTIKIAEKELDGIVWDEDGNITISNFDISTLPAFKPLTDPFNQPFATMTYDGAGNLYMGTVYPGDTTALFLVNEETLEPEFIGQTDTGLIYPDLAAAPSLGKNTLLATYGTFVLVVDGTTGAYTGVFDMTNNAGITSDIVGIAYIESEYNRQYRAYYDKYFLIDSDGVLYVAFFIKWNGSNYYFGGGTVGQVVDGVDLYYWQSLYYDAAEDVLYFSRFESESANVVEIYGMFNIWNGDYFDVFRVGTFNDGVWPVGGLFEFGVIPGQATNQGGHSAGRTFETVLGAPAAETLPAKAPADSAQKAPITLPKADGINKVVTTVKVDVTADVLTTNGIIDMYIPDTAEIVSIKGHAQYFEYAIQETDIENEDVRILKFAFVDLEGIETGDSILTVEFAAGSTGTVEIDTYNINGDDDNFAYEIVVLGPVEAFHTKHIYEALEWNWYVDDNGNQAATALIGCTWGDIDEFEQDAEITSEVVGGKIVYTATIILEDDQILTDTLELPIAAINGRSGNFGNVGVNFLLNIDESYFEDGADVKVVITKGIGDEAVEYEYLASECVSGTRYKFTVPTAVKEMADVLTLKVYTADGETLIPLFDKEGNDVTNTGYSFSMKEYCEIAMAQSSNEKMVALAEAYLDFGYAAMIKFDHNADQAEDFALIDDGDYSGLEEFAENVTDESLETIASSTATATFSSQIKLNKYFTFERGTDVSGYKFYLNGEEVDATKVSATKYLIEVEGIAIKDFDVAYEFRVVDEATGASYTVEYCVLSYFQKALASDKATPEMVDLAKAGYNVYLAAEEYFG